jgi:macrolide-specific efflux system membrane fusion protein
VKKKIIIFIAIIFVLAIAILIWKTVKAPEINYEEIKVEKGNISVEILATGTVQPENRLEIKPPVAGRIEKVLVDEGEKVTKGQILAWMSSNERAALIDSARALGKKELARWEKLFRPTPVMAPIDGNIILRNVEEGQSFTTNDPILVMSDRLTVKAQVDETDMALIKLKQKASIILDAYSEKGIPAKVDQIAFEAKTVNNVTTYLVDVLPENTPDFMRSGMTANVNFLLQEKKGVINVPLDVITTEEDISRVLIKGPQEEIFEREVKTGITDGKIIEILEGLSEGDIVLKEVRGPKKSSSTTNPFSPMRRKKDKSAKK